MANLAIPKDQMKLIKEYYQEPGIVLVGGFAIGSIMDIIIGTQKMFAIGVPVFALLVYLLRKVRVFDKPLDREIVDDLKKKLSNTKRRPIMDYVYIDSGRITDLYSSYNEGFGVLTTEERTTGVDASTGIPGAASLGMNASNTSHITIKPEYYFEAIETSLRSEYKHLNSSDLKEEQIMGWIDTKIKMFYHSRSINKDIVNMEPFNGTSIYLVFDKNSFKPEYQNSFSMAQDYNLDVEIFGLISKQGSSIFAIPFVILKKQNKNATVV